MYPGETGKDESNRATLMSIRVRWPPQPWFEDGVFINRDRHFLSEMPLNPSLFSCNCIALTQTNAAMLLPGSDLDVFFSTQF